MLEFLKKCNISDDVIKRIEQENSGANIYNLNCNEEEACKIITYLKKIGVINVNDLLIYRIDVFFESFETFKAKFSRYEINSLVQALNNDYTIINEI